MPGLFDDYIGESPELMARYAGAPRTLFEAAPAGGAWAGGVAEGLCREQARLGIARNFAGDEAVIVTGQQPGLFTGPLYTIYKAVTAIGAAALVTERTGTACVPIFWVGGEDHDFEEARTADFLTKQHERLHLRYEPPFEVAGAPMHAVKADPSLHAFIETVAGAVPGSERRGEVEEGLHATLDAADSLSDWCTRLLARLFAETPLVLFSPNLPEARAAAAAVMAQAIREPLACTRLVNEGGERLSALGYGAQVVKGFSECAFFLIEGERRCKVVFEDGQFFLPETGSVFNGQDLLELLAHDPQRFSPNVALRCIVQQALFPVAAYVAGPGEIAYWGQLEPLFAHFGQTMPVVYPRARCVLTTVKLNKLLRKLGLDVVKLAQPREALLQQALAAAVQSKGREAFRAHRPQVEAAVAALVRALSAQKGLADPAGGFAARVAAALEQLEDAVLRADATQVETASRQLERLCTALAPDRKPQERVYSVFSYVFEYGWQFPERLGRELDVTTFGLQEIEL